jgi:NAD(P)-dependent dehydrogenase (short-subunit alcohol dehydrogenase family)
MRLTGATAAVTGANRGIGLAVASRLAELGACVILAGRDTEACSAAAALLVSRGLSAEAYGAGFDAASPGSTAAFGAFCASRHVDLLVNNAGVCEPGWSRPCAAHTLRINVLSPRQLTHAVLPGMLCRRRGCVINVSSGDGELVYLHSHLQHRLRSVTRDRDLLRLLAHLSRGRDGFVFGAAPPAHGPTPAYALSKAALNAHTRLTATGLAPGGPVWVGAVCPGDVETRMCTVAPGGRALSPAEAAEDIVWLAAAAGERDDSSLGEDWLGGRLEPGRFWRQREQIPF